MLTTSILCFTKKGADLAKRIREFLSDTKCYSTYDCGNGLLPIGENLKDIVYKAFHESETIIFIGACGIAVRAIAPYIKSKDKDPGVIVIDENGTFIIPILSGHLGGANKAAKMIAEKIHGQAIITTSTDINQKFAVDLWAKEQGLFIHNIENIKFISSAVLRGEKISFSCEYELESELPQLFTKGEAPAGIIISHSAPTSLDKHILYLTPKAYVLGIGCRKDIGVKLLEDTILDFLQDVGISVNYLKTAASIDIKAKEPAIIAFCHKYKLELMTYTSNELKHADGEFTSSEFVRSIVGVDNVCERAALLASEDGIIIQGKKSSNGVTLAIAKKEWRCRL